MYAIIYFPNNTNDNLQQNAKLFTPKDSYPDEKIKPSVMKFYIKLHLLTNSFPNKLPSASNPQFPLDINKYFTVFRSSLQKILLSPTAEHISYFVV